MDNSEIGVSRSAETASPYKFQVEFDPYIQTETCPYKVEIQGEKIIELLQTLGLGEQSIKKLKLKFIERPIISPDGRSTGAVYENNIITISSGTWWEFLTKQLNSLEELVDSQGIDEVQTSQQVKASAAESLETQVQQKFDHDFIHETAHFAGDASLRKQAALSLRKFDFAGVGRFLMQRASKFGPEGIAQEENRAERVVENIQKQGKWQDLVVVSKK